MKDFAAIDFETANEQRTSVCSVGVGIFLEDIRKNKSE
jgi:DNA polymerase III subunit epsilon